MKLIRNLISGVAFAAMAAFAAAGRERRRHHDRDRLGAFDPRSAGARRWRRARDQRQYLRDADGAHAGRRSSFRVWRPPPDADRRDHVGIQAAPGHQVHQRRALQRRRRRRQRRRASSTRPLKSEQTSYFGTITGAEKVDDLTVRITTNGPDPILPSRMYWMKMIPPKYVERSELRLASDRHRAVRVRQLVARREHRAQGQPGLLGRRAVDRPGHLPLHRRARHAPLGPDGRRTRRDHQSPAGIRASVPKSAAVQGLETSVIVLSTENPSPRTRACARR